MGDLVVGEFRKIAEGVYLEGLSYDFKRDVVWYSDPLQGGVFGVTPDGISRGSFNLDRRWTGGVMMNADGSVLSTGPGGIMWNNPDTGERSAASRSTASTKCGRTEPVAFSSARTTSR